MKAGASNVKGFRAPIFSLTEKSSDWAYENMRSCGLTYSSSVLPAKNPLYGWEGFGESAKKMTGGIIEMPITLGQFGPLRIPIAGGVYFRVLPQLFLKNAIRQKLTKGLPVLSYFHPYDIDTEQERYMHAGINDSKIFNFLMYYNRKSVFNRLDALLNMDVKIMTCQKYVDTYLSNL
jgi:hypothetical protein